MFLKRKRLHPQVLRVTGRVELDWGCVLHEANNVIRQRQPFVAESEVGLNDPKQVGVFDGGSVDYGLILSDEQPTTDVLIECCKIDLLENTCQLFCNEKRTAAYPIFIRKGHHGTAVAVEDQVGGLERICCAEMYAAWVE